VNGSVIDPQQQQSNKLARIAPCIVSISFDLEARPFPAHFAVRLRSSGLANIRYLRHTHSLCSVVHLLATGTHWNK